jgi:hypothetical protein
MFRRSLPSTVLKLPWRIDKNCPKTATAHKCQQILSYAEGASLPLAFVPDSTA